MKNNTVTITLIGNMGSEAKLIEREGGKPFAAVSLATADSHKDDSGEWVQQESIWHDIVIFSPAVIGHIQGLKSGTRIKVTGTLSYRSFEMQGEDGKSITRREASIVATRVEMAPLIKKRQD